MAAHFGKLTKYYSLKKRRDERRSLIEKILSESLGEAIVS